MASRSATALSRVPRACSSDAQPRRALTWKIATRLPGYVRVFHNPDSPAARLLLIRSKDCWRHRYEQVFHLWPRCPSVDGQHSSTPFSTADAVPMAPDSALQRLHAAARRSRICNSSIREKTLPPGCHHQRESAFLEHWQCSRLRIFFSALLANEQSQRMPPFPFDRSAASNLQPVTVAR